MVSESNSSLTVSKQLKLLGLSSSSYYYKKHKRPELDSEAELKSDIQSLYAEQAAGYRVIHARLRQQGHLVGVKVVRRLMAELRLRGPYPKRNLSKACHEHKKYPYLLRGVEITHINHVWATDITYIKLEKGTAYLLAIIDIFSRKILSWRVSNTLATDFCLDALHEAFALYGKPEIFNTDQGSQFTSDEFTSALLDKEVKISMDGKGRALDNIYIERFWRTIKYDYLFRNECRTMPALKSGVQWFINYYNQRRPHQSLNNRTPDAVYFESLWQLLSSD